MFKYNHLRQFDSTFRRFPVKKDTRQRMRALGLRVLNGGGSDGCQYKAAACVTVERRGVEIFITIDVPARRRAGHTSDALTVVLNDRRFTGWRVKDGKLTLTLDARRRFRRIRQLIEEIFDEYTSAEQLLCASGDTRYITVAINGLESLVPLRSHVRRRALYVVKGA